MEINYYLLISWALFYFLSSYPKPSQPGDQKREGTAIEQSQDEAVSKATATPGNKRQPVVPAQTT
ncbi:hypothetical protein [Tellurirhabdus bombi]|uniref:hypothetical protein n=1 Tax=Tellurirhabdus bombi TaxID=2907205 RepID=UPI001F3C2D4F|nr:hypothetical protein [Tellurirhabdus bombi]